MKRKKTYEITAVSCVDDGAGEYFEAHASDDSVVVCCLSNTENSYEVVVYGPDESVERQYRGDLNSEACSVYTKVRALYESAASGPVKQHSEAIDCERSARYCDPAMVRL